MGATESNKRHGKKRANTGKRYEEGFLGFVDIPLTDAHRERIEELVHEDLSRLFDWVTGIGNDGYKFSLAYDPDHAMSIATITGKHAACVNLGYALSGRGPSGQQAILVLWFKHEQIAHGGAWVDEGVGPEDRQLPLWS